MFKKMIYLYIVIFFMPLFSMESCKTSSSQKNDKKIVLISSEGVRLENLCNPDLLILLPSLQNMVKSVLTNEPKKNEAEIHLFMFKAQTLKTIFNILNEKYLEAANNIEQLKALLVDMSVDDLRKYQHIMDLANGKKLIEFATFLEFKELLIFLNNINDTNRDENDRIYRQNIFTEKPDNLKIGADNSIKSSENVDDYFYEHVDEDTGLLLNKDFNAERFEKFYRDAPDAIKKIVEILNSASKKKKDINRRKFNQIMIFEGKPGNGKTKLAMALPSKLKRHYHLKPATDFLGKHRNEATENLRKFFDNFFKCKKKPVLIIDEITALTDKYLNESTDAFETSETFWQILDSQQDNLDFIMIGTTNNTKKMPPQLDDRLLNKIHTIPNLDADGCKKELFDCFEKYGLKCSDDCNDIFLTELSQKLEGSSHRKIDAIVGEVSRHFPPSDSDYDIVTKEILEKAFVTTMENKKKHGNDNPSQMTDEERRFQESIKLQKEGLRLQEEALKQGREQIAESKESRNIQVKLTECNIEIQEINNAAQCIGGATGAVLGNSVGNMTSAYLMKEQYANTFYKHFPDGVNTRSSESVNKDQCDQRSQHTESTSNNTAPKQQSSSNPEQDKIKQKLSEILKKLDDPRTKEGFKNIARNGLSVSQLAALRGIADVVTKFR